MPTILKTAVKEYLRVKESPLGTRNEYLTTLKKWGLSGFVVIVHPKWQHRRSPVTRRVYAETKSHGTAELPQLEGGYFGRAKDLSNEEPSTYKEGHSLSADSTGITSAVRGAPRS